MQFYSTPLQTGESGVITCPHFTDEEEEACVGVHGGLQDLMVRKRWSQDAKSCLLTGNHGLPSSVFQGEGLRG